MPPLTNSLLFLSFFALTQSLFVNDMENIKNIMTTNQTNFDRVFNGILYTRREEFLSAIFKSDILKRVANFQAFLPSDKNGLKIIASYFHSESGNEQDTQIFKTQIRFLPDPHNMDKFNSLLTQATLSGYICNVQINQTHTKDFNYMRHQSSPSAWGCYQGNIKPESQNIAFFYEMEHIVTSEGFGITIIVEESQDLTLDSPIFVKAKSNEEKQQNTNTIMLIFMDMARAVMNTNQNYFLHGSISPSKFLAHISNHQNRLVAELSGFEYAVDYETVILGFREGMHYNGVYQSPSLVFVQNHVVHVPHTDWDTATIDGYGFTPDMKEDVYALAASIIQIYNINAQNLDPADPRIDLVFRYLQSWVINLAKDNIEQTPDSEELFQLFVDIQNQNPTLPPVDRMEKFNKQPKIRQQVQIAKIIVVDKQFGKEENNQQKKMFQVQKTLKRFRSPHTCVNKLGEIF